MQIPKTSAQLDGSGSLMLDSQRGQQSAWGAPPQVQTQSQQSEAQAQPQVQEKRLDLADFHDTNGEGSLTDDSSFASGGVADAVASPTPRGRGRGLPFSQGRGYTHISSVPTPKRPPKPKKRVEDASQSAAKKTEAAAKNVVLRSIESVTPTQADRSFDPEALTNSLVINYNAGLSRAPSEASLRSKTPVQQIPPPSLQANAATVKKGVVVLDLTSLDSTLNGHLLGTIGTPKTPAKMSFGKGLGRGSAKNVVTLPDALQLSAPRSDKDEDARQKSHASLRSSRLSRIDLRKPVSDMGVSEALPEAAMDKRFEQFLDLKPNEKAKITRILTLANCDLKTLPPQIYRKLCEVAPHCTVLRLDGKLTTSFIGSIAELFTNVDCLHFSDIEYNEFQEVSLAQFTKLQNLKMTNSTAFFAIFAKVQPDTLATLFVEACPGIFPYLIAKMPHLRSLQGLHFSQCNDLQTSQIQQLTISFSHVQDIGIEDCEQVSPSITETALQSGVNVHFKEDDEARDMLEPEKPVIAERDELKAKAANAGTVTFGDLSNETSPKNVLVHDSRTLQRTTSRAKSISDLSISAISALSDGSAASGSKRKELYEQGLKATLALAAVFQKLLKLEEGTPDRPVPSPTPSQAQSEAQPEIRPSGSREVAEDAVSVSSSVRTIRAEKKHVASAIDSLTQSMRRLSVRGQRTPRKAADFKKFENANFTTTPRLVNDLFNEVHLNLDSIPKTIYAKVKSAASLITRLDVPGAQLSAKSLQILVRDFNKLRILNVTRADIHKGALKHFKGIAQLHIAESTGLDDQAVKDLLACRETLEVLDVSSTKITDASIKRILTEFPRLKTLSANRTAFTDAHVDLAAQCKTLTLLNVSGTQVTSEKVGQLSSKTLRVVRDA